MSLSDFLKMIENEYKVKTSGQNLPDSLRQIITRAYNEGVDYALMNNPDKIRNHMKEKDNG